MRLLCFKLHSQKLIPSKLHSLEHFVFRSAFGNLWFPAEAVLRPRGTLMCSSLPRTRFARSRVRGLAWYTCGFGSHRLRFKSGRTHSFASLFRVPTLEGIQINSFIPSCIALRNPGGPIAQRMLREKRKHVSSAYFLFLLNDSIATRKMVGPT